jgi:hypothetical protein
MYELGLGDLMLLPSGLGEIKWMDRG